VLGFSAAGACAAAGSRRLGPGDAGHRGLPATQGAACQE